MKCRHCDENARGGSRLCSKCYAKDYRRRKPEVAKEYNRRNKEKRNANSTNLNNKRHFGGKRFIVLDRDNWECQYCGMIQEQCMALFGRSLTIHHIDGNGRDSDNPNSDLNNLVTLCFRCHPLADRGDITFPISQTQPEVNNGK